MVFLIITFIVVALGVGTWFLFNPSNNFGECKVDGDCVKVQAGCCPCNMGGDEICVSSSEAVNYPPKNCSSRQICAAVYNCNKINCSCFEGKCQR